MQKNETHEERVARQGREREERCKIKSIGAIKVGKNRYFWMAYRYSAWLQWAYHSDLSRDAHALNAGGIDGEGFAATMDEAMAAAQRVADSLPGPMEEKYQHRNAKGNRWIRERYSKLYARKPPPSEETDARPIGMLGSLWRLRYSRDDAWIEYPITKKTAKRVFIGRATTASVGNDIIQVIIDDYRDTRQRSFDRGKLKEDGYAWCRSVRDRFYSDEGKADLEAGRRRYDVSAFPLLNLPAAATRAEVMATFRKLAKTAHPDAGGDAAAFRELVAEKDRALRQSPSNAVQPR